MTDRRIRLSREYEQQVQADKPGVANMLSEDDLREAASGGPIIVINASALRCDAIIVHRSGQRVVSLPGLTHSEARSTAIRYHESLHSTQLAVSALLETREAAKDPSWEAAWRFSEAIANLKEAQLAEDMTLTETLDWLWQAVVQPVKSHLVSLSANEITSRLWWCPTGPLVGLPLHAAATRPWVSAENWLDWATPSYTPTIAALLSARRSTADLPTTCGANSFLLLSLASTPGERPLPHVVAEAESILRLLPSDHVTLVENENATRGRAQRELASHRSVHLGCHAEQRLDDPSNGSLILHDGRLTVLELGRSRFDGDFAYLSACKTALGGIELAEESVNMAAALHFAGFRRVIATLWSVQDVIAAEVAELTYRQMIDNGRFNPDAAASALHHAVAHVRRENPNRPSLWAPFMHYGI